jgi:ribosomal protein S13
MNLYILTRNEKLGIDNLKLSLKEYSKKILEEAGEAAKEAYLIEETKLKDRVHDLIQEDLDTIQVIINRIYKLKNDYNVDIENEINQHNFKVVNIRNWAKGPRIEIKIYDEIEEHDCYLKLFLPDKRLLRCRLSGDFCSTCIVNPGGRK